MLGHMVAEEQAAAGGLGVLSHVVMTACPTLSHSNRSEVSGYTQYGLYGIFFAELKHSKPKWY